MAVRGRNSGALRHDLEGGGPDTRIESLSLAEWRELSERRDRPIDLLHSVVEVRRKTQVARPQCDVDSRRSQAFIDRSVLDVVPRAHDDDRGALVRVDRAHEAQTDLRESLDEAADEPGVIRRDLVESLLEQLLHRGGPGHEIQEVGRSEHVVGAGTEVVPEAVLSLLVEIESEAVR